METGEAGLAATFVLRASHEPLEESQIKSNPQSKIIQIYGIFSTTDGGENFPTERMSWLHNITVISKCRMSKLPKTFYWIKTLVFVRYICSEIVVSPCYNYYNYGIIKG